jgi:hypothetical protein
MDYCGKSFFKLLSPKWSLKEIQQIYNNMKIVNYLHLWMQKVNNETCMNTEQARMDLEPSNLRL